MSEVYPHHIMHDNPLMEDEHFALVFAQAFINTNTVPTQELCERWLAEGYVNEEELEMILIHKSSKHISTSSSIVGSVLSVITTPVHYSF